MGPGGLAKDFTMVYIKDIGVVPQGLYKWLIIKIIGKGKDKGGTVRVSNSPEVFRHEE